MSFKLQVIVVPILLKSRINIKLAAVVSPPAALDAKRVGNAATENFYGSFHKHNTIDFLVCLSHSPSPSLLQPVQSESLSQMAGQAGFKCQKKVFQYPIHQYKYGI